ncbi:hypothetical protein NPIL_241081 [Nephila pilipes]|uniref:Uncharacterized protein n=1 Tax=Nephila pilipes TaxID=299642 RepID=A0A8X6UCL3_NEPPI|nr:hypothetical protein NPIL_241081 [Nephila pilipes]
MLHSTNIRGFVRYVCFIIESLRHHEVDTLTILIMQFFSHMVSFKVIIIKHRTYFGALLFPRWREKKKFDLSAEKDVDHLRQMVLVSNGDLYETNASCKSDSVYTEKDLEIRGSGVEERDENRR